MFEAILLLLAIGVMWTGVAVILEKASARKIPISTFFAVGVFMVTVFSWLFIVDWKVLLSGEKIARMDETILWMSLAGIANGVGQMLLVRTMTAGHKAVGWAMAQSAMVVPFLMSIIIWRDNPGLTAIAGTILIVTAMGFMSYRKREKNPEKGNEPIPVRWFMLALGCFAVLGMTQTLQMIPSRWENWQDTASLRLPVMYGANCVVQILVAAFYDRAWPDKKVFSLAAYWATLAVLAFLTLLYCLDRMANVGMVAVVFPVAIGLCVLGFAIYSRIILREPFSKMVKIGMAANIAGILLMSFR